jgi:uncharacterized protein Yka (UPF0111/DUF47 family)
MADRSRRTVRNKFLDASVAPIERACLARAEFLDNIVVERMDAGDTIDLLTLTSYRVFSDQLRALAEELHWW